MQNVMRVLLVVVALGLVGVAGYSLGVSRSRERAAAQLLSLQENEELRRMHDEDQADRSAADPKVVDWAVVGTRDRTRRSRVMTLFAEGRLTTANDYYHAAMILQHGDIPEDFLLAHEFAVVAIIKGRNDRQTRWLSAAAEDRFLTKIGRPQRFATEFSSQGDGPWRLNPVDPTVTDELRRLMGAHSLAEARMQEAELNKKR